MNAMYVQLGSITQGWDVILQSLILAGDTLPFIFSLFITFYLIKSWESLGLDNILG